MRVGVLALLTLVGTSISAAAPFTLPGEDRVLPSSLELERRTQPWCPNDCVVLVPFVARYSKGAEQLVFVGARHAFRPNDPTMRAVAAGFAEIEPKVVILEGFPTAMGENPAPLVAEAHRYGAPDADEFARGESMDAASVALRRGIPFVGGEPTQDVQLEVLRAKGFTAADIAFSSLLGWFSQALRSGDMPDTSVASLAKVYPKLAENVRAQIHLQAPALAAFLHRYKEIYGVDLVGDAGFPLRTDVVNDRTRNGEQSRVNMMTRDRHLLGLIEQQLSAKHRVLVVFGGSHWSTLSAALEQRLGRPVVTPYLK